MRLVGWPANYDKDEGLQPLEIKDIDLHGTAEELRVLSQFLEQAAFQLDQAKTSNQELNIGIDFEDDKPNSETGIWVNVVHHVT